MLRRDADASGTRVGGWITRLEVFFPTIIGVQYGIWIGLIAFGLMWMLRAVVGYLDLTYLNITKYTNHYITERAPANVVVIKKVRK